MARLHRASRWQLLWRSGLSAPFALSLVLTLVLGPATIDSKYGSFTWLAVLSLVATLLMFSVKEGWLIPVGVVTFLVFPGLSGLGFYFAPAWAERVVAISFYGALLASAAATLTGIVHVLRRVRSRRRGVLAIRLVGLGLLALVMVAVSITSAPLRASAEASGSGPKAVNMGPIINTAHREAEPSFTADGRTMYFNCHDSDICVTHLVGTWEQGQWTTPQIVGPPISSDYVEVEPWINAVGDKLYFNSLRPFATGSGLPGLSLYVEAVGLLSQMTTDNLGISLFGGLGEDDIWVSALSNGVWSEPRTLNDVRGEPPVNTPFMDHCLAFSADGNEAFWTSTRPGGFGDNDIWTSRRVDGTWTKAENLGPNVNGPWSEHHSILTPDGRSLYVTSDRPGGAGLEDIYVTTRGADGRWGKLVDVGPLVNGPGNDRCAAWTPDGKIFLFDSDRAGGFGSKDLWWVSFKDVTGHPLAPP
jgi:WD40-like Beta Propeller Repeat